MTATNCEFCLSKFGKPILKIEYNDIVYEYLRRRHYNIQSGEMCEVYVCMFCDNLKRKNELFKEAKVTYIHVNNGQIIDDLELHRQTHYCQGRTLAEHIAIQADRNARQEIRNGNKRPVEAYKDAKSQAIEMGKTYGFSEAQVEGVFPAFKTVRRSYFRHSPRAIGSEDLKAKKGRKVKKEKTTVAKAAVPTEIGLSPMVTITDPTGFEVLSGQRSTYICRDSFTTPPGAKHSKEVGIEDHDDDLNNSFNVNVQDEVFNPVDQAIQEGTFYSNNSSRHMEDDESLFGKSIANFLRTLDCKSRRRAKIGFEQFMMDFEASLEGSS